MDNRMIRKIIKTLQSQVQFARDSGVTPCDMLNLCKQLNQTRLLEIRPVKDSSRAMFVNESRYFPIITKLNKNSSYVKNFMRFIESQVSSVTVFIRLDERFMFARRPLFTSCTFSVRRKSSSPSTLQLRSV
ncbi:hypothetical protein TNCV_412951 [Trichonephila clavipes]|nr:hypothetical protein TNCV_412951 [Trichonephila clavipes]